VIEITPTESEVLSKAERLYGADPGYNTHAGVDPWEQLLAHVAGSTSQLEEVLGSAITLDLFPTTGSGWVEDALKFIFDYYGRYLQAPSREEIADETGLWVGDPADIPLQRSIDIIHERRLRVLMKHAITGGSKRIGDPVESLEFLLRELNAIAETTPPIARRRVGGGDAISVVPFSSIAYKRLDWLWPGWIPKANITVLAGDGGIGKSHFLVGLAARLSLGDGVNGGVPGNTLIMSAEDTAESVILPRLVAAGANTSRVMEIYADNTLWKRSLTLSGDIDSIASAIEKYSVDLLIIDPGSSFLDDSVESHNDKSMRRALGPLAGVAMQQNTAIVYLAHLNKNVGGTFMERIIGSVGAPNAARSVIGMAVHPDDADTRVVAHVKANWAERQTSITFAFETATVELDGVDGPEVVETTRLVKTGTTGLTADQLVARREKERASPAFDAAANFLDALAADLGAAIPAAALNEAADRAGISAETLRRAKKDRGWTYDRSARTWISPGAALPATTDTEIDTSRTEAPRGT
jgi:hypothetical protein